MKDKLILSKLNKPEISERCITRQRLINILNAYNSKDLILVSSYAGTGKSTLIGSWLDNLNLPYVWYSIDSWDNDMQLFLAYLIEGIKKLDENVAKEIGDLYFGINTIGYDAFCRAFVNILQTIKQRFVLILDDFHNIDDLKIEEFIKFIIDYCPSKVLVVITSREDPSFPLSKLRLNNRLIEIRDKDLKITKDESRDFISRYTNVDLTDEDTSLLIDKTEGWVAGLQLSAISLENQNDTHRFIKDFSGSNYYIVDYLMEEVLNHQDIELRNFMLYTSLLDYFNCDLCDQMMSYDKGISTNYINEMLKKNLFLIPVDQTRTWFRFHHLFKDILNQRLTSTIDKSELNKYHIRAAHYYREYGQYQNAINHYLIGDNPEGAAELIELMWSDMDIELKAGLWLSLVKKLPTEIIMHHPVLCLGYGWALIDTGIITGYDYWFDQAKNLHDRYILGDTTEIVVVDKKQFNMLPSTVASAKGYMAAAMGDTNNLVEYANEALNNLPEDQYYKRGVTSMLLAMAHWINYEYDQAIIIIKQSMKYIEAEVNLLVKYSFKMVEAEINIHRGYLNEATRIIDHSLSDIEGNNIAKPLIATFYMLKANIAYLMHDNELALKLIDISYDFGEQMALIDWRYKYHRLYAQISLGVFDYNNAITNIEKYREFFTYNPLPDETSIEIIEQLIIFKKGNQLKSLDDQYLTSSNYNDSLNYIYLKINSEVDSKCIKDMYLIAKDISKKAFENNILSILVRSKLILGLCNKAQGDEEGYNRFIKEAYEIALVEKYFRPFFDYLTPDQVSNIFDSFIDSKTLDANSKLPEPLTSRELDVLNLIALGKSNKEICNELYLALSTVKGYTQNIYGKLEVSRRTEAIARARSIGLIK